MTTDPDVDALSPTSFRIAHLFADFGVEAEMLAACGSVHRYTLDPVPNSATTTTTAMDLMEETPDEQFDLALLHPLCTKWSDMPDVEPADHPNQIPRAREIAREIATDHIIENKPRAPLDDPVKLTGRMFGLPIAYKRAFETTFEVAQPPRQKTLGGKTVTPYFYSDRTREWWAMIKGYRGNYPKEHIAKNALPAAYVSYLVRNWLESLDSRDSKVPQDNNDPAPPGNPLSQSTLVEVGGGDTDG